MMYCPICKIKIDGKFCPECGSKLIEEEPSNQINLDLGDANAISGGINVTDSHNISNIDNSVHNIDNRTNVVNNYTNVAAQKTSDEIRQESRAIFRSFCDELFSKKTVLDHSDMALLQNKIIELGLEDTEANDIISLSKEAAFNKGHNISPKEQILVNLIIDAVKSNERTTIDTYFSRYESLAQGFLNVEEIQYYYYLILAALWPNKLIELYNDSLIDEYWKTFWAAIAFLKLGKNSEHERCVLDLSRFQGFPPENEYILDAMSSYINSDLLLAKRYLSSFSNSTSSYLKPYVEEILSSIQNKSDSTVQVLASGSFYGQFLVNFTTPKELAKQIKYTIYITAVESPLLGLMVTRTELGWDTATARNNFDNLPCIAIETVDKDKADVIAGKLVKGQMKVKISAVNALGDIIK